MSPFLLWRRPAVSIITTSTLLAIALWSVSKATEAGSAPIFCFTTGTSARRPHSSSCSMAAARKVSAAPSITLLPARLNCAAILPMVVVLPTPLTPTTIITWGRLPGGSVKSSSEELSPFSASISEISSQSRRLSSEAPTYLSRATRAWSRSMMRSVVSTPTSEVTNTSSRLSSTSSSTVDFPAMA